MADKRITDVDFIDSLDSNESFFVNQNNAIKQINKKDITFGIANGGTGATTPEEARTNLGAVSISNTTVELTVDGWTNNQQIVSVNGMGANDAVFATPNPDTDNYLSYIECNIRCIAQTEGMLTFLCDDAPNIAITVNIAVIS